MKRIVFACITALILVACGGSDDGMEPGGNGGGNGQGGGGNGGGGVTGSLTITINGIVEITEESATASASIIVTGDLVVSSRGFCWSKTVNPTTDDNTVSISSGAGTYQGALEALEDNTLYYVRAFAIEDGTVQYSEQDTFTTLEAVNSTVFDGHVGLSTQEEVNDFGANNYTEITGVLFIEGGNSITDLSPLSSLTKIGDMVRISGNTSLPNLNGLHNITEIGSALFIFGNSLLENLEGLNSLTSTQSGLSVNVHENMRSLNGLENLTSTGGLVVRENPLLADITALSSLTESGTTTISQNPILTTLDGLQNLTLVNGALQISRNDMLQNLSHLTSVERVEGQLVIELNPSLTTIGGLNNLTFILYDLRIDDNALTEISDFRALTTVGLDLKITFDNIAHIDGFESLVQAGGVWFRGNTLLTNLDGFSSLLMVEDNFRMTSNSSLTDFCGITNLVLADGIGGSLILEFNGHEVTEEDIINGNCSL